LDAESHLRAAREKDEQSEHSTPIWQNQEGDVKANSVWAWDTSSTKCLMVSATGECRLWKLTDGSDTEVLTPAQHPYRASTSVAGKLTGVVHVSGTQLWAVALARSVILCSENGPVTSITNVDIPAGASFASTVARFIPSSNEQFKRVRSVRSERSMNAREGGLNQKKNSSRPSSASAQRGKRSSKGSVARGSSVSFN